MKKINLIIKPTAKCNLRCQYCYHAPTNYTDAVLPIEHIEKLFDLCSKEYDSIRVIWHGGEPLIVGQEYYKKIFKIQEKIQANTKTTFCNSIQTNGTLINTSWCSFFKKHNLQPGISFDGPKNEFMRQGTQDVLTAMKILQKKKINVNILSVINQSNINQIELYEYIKKLGVASAKFNPIFSETHDNRFSIEVSDYIDSTKKLFDYWLYDVNGIKITPLTSYMYKSLGLPFGDCAHGSCLGRWIDMDSQGTLRTCGQSLAPIFELGNIKNVESIADIFEADNFNTLLASAIARREKCILSCDLFKYCQGGCIFKSYIDTGIENLNDFDCIVFKALFNHVYTSVHTVISNEVSLDKLNPCVANIITEAVTIYPDGLLSLKKH